MRTEQQLDEESNTVLQKRSRMSKADRELLHRLYNAPEYTAVARAIGAEEWDVEDARDLVVPLMKQFGVQRVLAVTESLLSIESRGKHTIARLTDDARRYAKALIGPVGCDAAELPRKRLKRLKLVEPDATHVATDYVPVDKKRSHVVERFANHMKLGSITFHDAKDVELFLPEKQRTVAFDFLIERHDERQIALVRRELSNQIRTRLARLLNRLGPNYVGLRAWPIQAERAWLWEKEWIVQGDADSSVNDQSASATPVLSPDGQSTAPTSSLPHVQRELF